MRPGQGTRSHIPQLKVLYATNKTWNSQINKYIYFLRERKTRDAENRSANLRKSEGKLQRETDTVGWEQRPDRAGGWSLPEVKCPGKRRAGKLSNRVWGKGLIIGG